MILCSYMQLRELICYLITGQITYGTLISEYLTQCRPVCGPLFLQLQQEKVFPTLHSLRGGYETYNKGVHLVQVAGLPSPLLIINQYLQISCNLNQLLSNKRPQLWPKYGKNIVTPFMPLPANRAQPWQCASQLGLSRQDS